MLTRQDVDQRDMYASCAAAIGKTRVIQGHQAVTPWQGMAMFRNRYVFGDQRADEIRITLGLPVVSPVQLA